MDWIDSAPAIGEDGTVYVGTRNGGYYPLSWGYLHAIGYNPNVPSAPDINGPTNGKINVKYTFTFCATSPVGNDIYYCVDWADHDITNWLGPYPSGEPITLSKRWRLTGKHIIRVQAKDTDGNYGSWSEFNMNIKSRNRAYSNTLILRFLEQFPVLRGVILRLIPK